MEPTYLADHVLSRSDHEFWLLSRVWRDQLVISLGLGRLSTAPMRESQPRPRTARKKVRESGASKRRLGEGDLQRDICRFPKAGILRYMAVSPRYVIAGGLGS